MRAFPKLWGQNAAAINEAIAVFESRCGSTQLALLAWCHALKAKDDRITNRIAREITGIPFRSR